MRKRRIITVCSTKGGVGKTTTVANLGPALADSGARVLLVDCDIQPALSSYYPLVDRANHGLSRLLTEANPDGCISRTAVGCDIVVSDDPEGQLQNWALHTPDGRIRLRYALDGLRDYDVILIDSQGAVSPLQDAAVLAADSLLSPIPPEMLSAREFSRGTLAMLDRLAPMRHLGAPVGKLHGLICRIDRTVDAREIASELRRQACQPAGRAIEILKTVVPATVAYRNAASAQTPIHRFEPHRPGPSPSGCDTMSSLIAELLPNIGNIDSFPAAADTPPVEQRT